jgi:hypothetical protein
MNARYELRKCRYTPIVVSHDDWPWPELLVATDVSPGGIYIATDKRVDIDDSLRLSFRLGTDDLWELDGCVVRTQSRQRRTDPGFSGFGVELFGASPMERLRMRSLIRHEPPPVPDLGLDKGIAAVRTNRRRPGRWGGRRQDDFQTPRCRSRWVHPQKSMY